MLYRLVTWLFLAAVWWGRVRVEGIEAVPTDGPLLLAPTHDSQWDPIVIAAVLESAGACTSLARAELWDKPLLGPLLYGLGQIPIRRGEQDRGALDQAVAKLREGEAVCVFPEGRLSHGEAMRARSGVGWLAHACPGVQVVLCTVEGATGYVRFPRRPRVRIHFFAPALGDVAPGEEPAALAGRLLAELRDRVPPVAAGRRR